MHQRRINGDDSFVPDDDSVRAEAEVAAVVAVEENVEQTDAWKGGKKQCFKGYS